MNPEKSFQKKLDLLPQDAQIELMDLYVNDPSRDDIEIIKDPQVEGCYAVQVSRFKEEPFHLLWTKGGFDEVEFHSWPPTSSFLRFF